MRAVVQRVQQAAVEVEAVCVGSIPRGLLVFLGVERGDTIHDAEYLADKIAGLRVFEDGEGRMNLDVRTVQGGLLVISQFTLLGDVRRGKRPSFTSAAAPSEAEHLYQCFCGLLQELGLRVERGVFQADMQISLVNDGPVTILLDSRKLF